MKTLLKAYSPLINKIMKTNTAIRKNPVFTHEGGKADNINALQQLKRSVLTYFLWENSFYEDGVSIANRIKDLVPKVAPEKVAQLAIDARTKYKLRHVPLFLVREMARHEKSRCVVADTLSEIIQRPDELAEFLAIYWADGKQPLAASVKKGLAQAFTKFNEFSLSRYNQANTIKLRDVLFLSHAKPVDKAQEKLWKRLINDELETPVTWETVISATKGEGKKEAWEKLLKENKLGALALLRNLRGMKEVGVNEKLIANAIEKMNTERVLPFRFISAAKYYPALEEHLEKSMFKCLSGHERLKGKTALIIDTSPSMWLSKISAKSEMDRFDAAAALAIIIREICEDVRIYTFNKKAYEIPNRHGFALRDAMAKTKDGYSCGSLAIEAANNDGYDRVICLTDGQWHSVRDGQPSNIEGDAINYKSLVGSNAYMINVSNNKNGIGYKNGWTALDGFSETIVDYIIEAENLDNKL